MTGALAAGPTLPNGSIAFTSSVCRPARRLHFLGETQAANGLLSARQTNVAPAGPEKPSRTLAYFFFVFTFGGGGTSIAATGGNGSGYSPPADAAAGIATALTSASSQSPHPHALHHRVASPRMSVTNAALNETAARTPEATLREVVEHLAAIETGAGSEGEREAAEWIAARLGEAGAPASVDEERYLHGWAPTIGKLSALGALAGLAGLTRRGRALGVAGGLAAAGLIADDISNGARPARRVIEGERTTWNAVAEIGDPEAERTVVVVAHHDAAHTGRIFESPLQPWLVDTFPGIVERVDTSIPQWWPVVGAPALVALGAATGRRALVATGTALAATAAALLADIAKGSIVPGANDNLTAVAVIVALAEALRERPVRGVRVVLASVGAEEVLQGGIHGFAKRHLKPLDRERTWVIVPDTVGSPGLIMLEGEGPMVMEDYYDRSFRDLVARVAERDGLPLRRGMRSRFSTDAVIPSRMGIPTVCLASMDRNKALSNYHLPSDTPENVRYPTVAVATDLVEAVIRELALPA